MCSRVRLAEVNTAGVTPPPPATDPRARMTSAAEEEVSYPTTRIHMQSGAVFAGFYCTYENDRQKESTHTQTHTL